jgi:hypothetical protein
MAEMQSTETVSYRRSLPVRGGLAVVLSVLANALLVVGIGALEVAPGFRPLTLPPVVFLSAVGAVGATAVYWLLDRYVDDVDRTFPRVAAAVLVLSFVPDLALLGADPAATVLGVFVLMVMHVVVAAASVGVLVYWGRTR